MATTKSYRSNIGLSKRIRENINKETRKRKHLKGSNLATLQQNGLNYLKNNKQHVALIEDKNIGPCIDNRNDCIAAMMKQHCGNLTFYERASKEQEQKFIEEAIKLFIRSQYLD